MKKKGISAPGIGGSALLVIFGVLCMSVFSMLSLSTALAEKRLSEASAQTVAAYYEADLQAQEILARLRAGEQVSGVEVSGNVYTYACPISENRWLEAELLREADGYMVLRWQTVALPPEADRSLPVWNGTE